MPHDRPAHGDALVLAAGQLLRQTVEQLPEREDICGLGYQLVDGGFVAALKLQRKSHILRDGHVRIERIALKDHGNIALLGVMERFGLKLKGERLAK